MSIDLVELMRRFSKGELPFPHKEFSNLSMEDWDAENHPVHKLDVNWPYVNDSNDMMNKDAPKYVAEDGVPIPRKHRAKEEISAIVSSMQALKPQQSFLIPLSSDNKSEYNKLSSVVSQKARTQKVLHGMMFITRSIMPPQPKGTPTGVRVWRVA